MKKIVSGEHAVYIKGSLGLLFSNFKSLFYLAEFKARTWIVMLPFSHRGEAVIIF